MSKFTLKVKLLHKNAVMPKFNLHGDAGIDICSCESVLIRPGERTIIHTGLAAEFPEGFVALVWDKSSVVSRLGLKVMAGVIDSGYRGEWKIVLLNTSDKEVRIDAGEEVAQVLMQPVLHPIIEEAAELGNSDRMGKGFGTDDLRTDG